MSNIDLLSPVGDFDCLKAAIQNGADSVYFGGNSFNARAFASNFEDDSLRKSIEYAKLRGVNTNLTLNTLIKDSEFDDAILLAKKAYEYGIDAIIVQDLGLATFLIKNFHNLPIHASTQMTVHNLEGALELQKLGFKRAVLSRELSISEIEYICKNSDIEIECFVHGALCISYSGQCLFSSMIGGRSGNRGKCAQPCRLPYELIEKDNLTYKSVDKGYLLSPKDLCGLEFLPKLINAGVTCLKIEGRMKSPEYVATVTRIYRKYINLILSKKEYSIDKKDVQDLLQVFNRGGFSNGHLENTPNHNLIYKLKPNNMGLNLGNVSNFNKNKGYITLKLQEPLSIGDTISFENENSKYTVSELMLGNNNIPTGNIGQTVTIGRMKGNINVKDKIYKMSDKKLTLFARETFKDSTEHKKIPLSCNIVIKRNTPISLQVKAACDNDIYKNICININSNSYPIDAINKPISKERIIQQISKTNNTPFIFKDICIDLDEDLFINISVINELRRDALTKFQNIALNNIKRDPIRIDSIIAQKYTNPYNDIPKISICLNTLDLSFNYTKLHSVDNIYIPLNFFYYTKYENTLNQICTTFNTFIYLPPIMKDNYRNMIKKQLGNIINTYNIKGLVLSNIADFKFIEEYKNKLIFIGNYTLNLYNTISISELSSIGINTVTISPELDKTTIDSICSNSYLNTELIVYGKIPVMTSNYCLLGKSNKCHLDCNANCKKDRKYYLKDRLGFEFRILPDSTQTITSIYNSKILSLNASDFKVNSVRVNILDENVEEINNIIDYIKSGKRIEGKNFTNGNLNRDV